jgi:glycosyltransferase involved in cell wall biosynthesis
MALRAADLLTCDAAHMQRAMMEMGVEEKKIARINFATDLQLFKPGPTSAALKERLGIAGSPVVISTRDLRKIYNVETLIEAVPLVLRRHGGTKFVILGSGPEGPRLKALAEALGVAQSVRFAGRVPPDDLPEYLRMADIYVSTSRSDAGLASSTAEAMACELPVIITDFGDNRDWVTDGENGFVISIADVAGLAERINVLLEDERMRRLFGGRNRRIIAERSYYGTEMKKMEALFQQMIKA